MIHSLTVFAISTSVCLWPIDATASPPLLDSHDDIMAQQVDDSQVFDGSWDSQSSQPEDDPSGDVQSSQPEDDISWDWQDPQSIQATGPDCGTIQWCLQYSWCCIFCPHYCN